MQAQAEASLLAGQLAEERAQRQRLEGLVEQLSHVAAKHSGS